MNTESQSERLNPQVADQVRQLLANGYKISIERASTGQFRTGSWQLVQSIQGDRESDIFAQLQGSLANYDKEYVRIVGIDPKSKRRVTELIVRRPTQQNEGATSGMEQGTTSTMNIEMPLPLPSPVSGDLFSTPTAYDEDLLSQITLALAELDKADTRIGERQAVTNQLKEDTRQRLSDLAEVVKRL